VFVPRETSRNRAFLCFLVIVGRKRARQHLRPHILHDIRKHSRRAALRNNVRPVGYKPQAVAEYHIFYPEPVKAAVLRSHGDLHTAAHCKGLPHEVSVYRDVRQNAESLRTEHQFSFHCIALAVQSGKAAALHRKMLARRRENHRGRRDTRRDNVDHSPARFTVDKDKQHR